MSTDGRIIGRLQLADLLGIQAGRGGQARVGRDGLGDRGLQDGQLLLCALEVDRGRGDDLARVDEIDLRRETAAHEEHARAGKVGHVGGDEEAREGEGTARDAGEEDVGRVEGHHLWEDLLYQVVDGLGMGDTVGTAETLRLAGGLTPEKLFCYACEGWVYRQFQGKKKKGDQGKKNGRTRRRQNYNTHKSLLDGLVGEIEEGLASITVEEDIYAHGSLSTGLLSTTSDA